MLVVSKITFFFFLFFFIHKLIILAKSHCKIMSQSDCGSVLSKKKQSYWLLFFFNWLQHFFNINILFYIYVIFLNVYIYIKIAYFKSQLISWLKNTNYLLKQAHFQKLAVVTFSKTLFTCIFFSVVKRSLKQFSYTFHVVKWLMKQFEYIFNICFSFDIVVHPLTIHSAVPLMEMESSKLPSEELESSFFFWNIKKLLTFKLYHHKTTPLCFSGSSLGLIKNTSLILFEKNYKMLSV